MVDWFVNTLRTYPEIAIFLSLAIGYWIGSKTFKGIGLGSVTGTLLAAVLIGQLGITISPPLKATFFLIFLFAVGYGVGPQFVRGVAKDGLPQALFAVVVTVLCLASAYVAAVIAGYDPGVAAGLYAGSQTISASMGLATDAINRLGLAADETKQMLDMMPVAYAVTYIFGTAGSAIVLALVAPRLLGIDLEAACKDYESKLGASTSLSGAGTAWHRFEMRAFKVPTGARIAGLSVGDAERLLPNERIFINRIRHGGAVAEATTDMCIEAGDVIAITARRETLVSLLSPKGANAPAPVISEVEDHDLLRVPAGGVEVFVTSKQADGKTLDDLSKMPFARGVFLNKITRGATATDIPILPNTVINRGDILSLVGRTQDTDRAAKELGYADRATDVTDVMFVGAAIVVGALIGAILIKVGSVPLTLSTAGGVLIAGLIFGWLRSIRPMFGRIPTPALWFMNSVGLNIFIAVIGISAGPNFVAGLQKLGIGIFLWGVVATTVPLILSAYIGKYLFKFHDAILLGAVSGGRTTTASLGMICDIGKSQVPGLGYTVTYAVGNTLLTLWGMVIVMLMT